MTFPTRWRSAALAVAAIFLAVFAWFSPQPAHAQDKPALFVNVTSEDPWKVSMAAFFGTQFALKQGHLATMFVNVSAVPLFTKARAGMRSPGFDKTVHEMLQEFRAAGGTILVCPVCMKPLGLTEGDLVDGAAVATVKSVNDVLFRADTKTLNW